MEELKMDLRLNKRIEDLRREHCGTCNLYSPDHESTTKEMHDCCLCYRSALKGSYHFPIIRQYRIEGT